MHVITYDISKNKIRNKVSKILEDYGVRVQYSVFESDMNEDELKKVMNYLRSIIDPSTDNIKFYSLCLNCEKKILSLGVDKSFTIPDAMVI